MILQLILELTPERLKKFHNHELKEKYSKNVVNKDLRIVYNKLSIQEKKKFY